MRYLTGVLKQNENNCDYDKSRANSTLRLVGSNVSASIVHTSYHLPKCRRLAQVQSSRTQQDAGWYESLLLGKLVQRCICCSKHRHSIRHSVVLTLSEKLVCQRNHGNNQLFRHPFVADHQRILTLNITAPNT